jgi:hypothetical protein
MGILHVKWPYYPAKKVYSGISHDLSTWATGRMSHGVLYRLNIPIGSQPYSRRRKEKRVVLCTLQYITVLQWDELVHAEK